ncbi:leucine-rich repeat-containing protein 74A-like [Mercenaria mercenaria]|uniref:leucine-rich repeat-containing protein 74A-like n=1 Tax=Mercenaria mercenaria TaxID=6596 RepID=UPI00234EE5C2|nr:leucine-rich repeat-containing protein 74A-like [Mercenaria mercenaria]
MKPMTRIDLSKNKFERRHAEIISEIIQKNDYIEEIVLSGNKFDDVSGVSLGKALGSNVGIKKLDLSWNHLRRGGAQAVCMALKFNQTLEELDLSWNGLAEEGCRALGVALPFNHTLKELDLSCNRISIFCLRELLKGLEHNDTLKVLRVDQNPMTTDGAIGLIKCLQKSKVSELTDLYMTDIPINSDFLDELDELLKVRQVRVYHRDPNKKKITPIIRKRTLKDYDPAMILFEYMKQENLRLIDLFRTFDTDSSQTVSKDELKEGFLTINMPLNEEALDSLFERLDLNDNDEIEYEEVKSGYRKTMSKLRVNDEDEHQAAAIAGLKKLVQNALTEKRKTMRADATKKVFDRRQSLRAIFQIRK